MRPLNAIRIFLFLGVFHTAILASLSNHGGLYRGHMHPDIRDLGLLDGWSSDGQGEIDPENPAEQPTVDSQGAGTPSKTDTNPFDIFSLATDTEKQSKTKESTSMTDSASTAITGTMSSQATTTPSATSSIVGSSPTASAPDTGGHSSNALSTSSGNSTWKIVGVAVISFSVVASILIAAVFFDHWWRFIRDICWKYREPEAIEEMIPDWEKASWEVRFGDDRHRYPSFTSMPSTMPGQSELQRNGSRKVKEWTKSKRLSGEACGLNGGLTPAERTTLSPEPLVVPSRAYLSPDPRPNYGGLDPFLDKARSPLLDAHGPSTVGNTSTTRPVGSPSGNKNPFLDRPTPTASTEAYDGMVAK